MTANERRVAGILLIAGVPLYIISEIARPIVGSAVPDAALFIIENLGGVILVAFAAGLIYGFWRFMGSGTRLDLSGRIGLILVAFGASTFLVGNLANTIVTTVADYTVEQVSFSNLLEEGVDAALDLIIFLVHLASTQGILIGTLAVSVFLAKRMTTPSQIWFARVVIVCSALGLVLASLAAEFEFAGFVAMATIAVISVWYVNLGVALYRHGDGIVATPDEGADAPAGGDLQMA